MYAMKGFFILQLLISAFILEVTSTGCCIDLNEVFSNVLRMLRSHTNEQLQQRSAPSTLAVILSMLDDDERRLNKGNVSVRSSQASTSTSTGMVSNQYDPSAYTDNFSSYSPELKKKLTRLAEQLDRTNREHSILINRSTIIQDSYKKIYNESVKNLRSNLEVKFTDEIGFGRGVLRDWISVLSKAVFDPSFGLFKYSTESNYILEINPFSGKRRPDHLKYFRFIGRLFGIAIYQGVYLDVSLSRLFYKVILGKSVGLEDIKLVDPVYYRSLIGIKEIDVINLGLTFCVTDDELGEHELKRNGSRIRVTNENKDEFIRLLLTWKLLSQVEQQMKFFMTGLHDLVPQWFLNWFDEIELEFLICGVRKVDVYNWKSNTEYETYHETSNTIILFWEVVSNYSDEMKSKLLQFTTGSSRVPIGGFASLTPKFFIKSKCGSIMDFPWSGTCSNTLCLPPYKTYDEMKNKLTYAVLNTDGLHLH